MLGAPCWMFEADDRAGVIPTHVELGNATADPQEFDLVVEYDDEILHESTYEVGAGGGEHVMGGDVVTLDEPPEPGIVEMHVSVEAQSLTLDFDSAFAQREYGGERVIGVFTYGMRSDTDERALTATSVLTDRPNAESE